MIDLNDVDASLARPEPDYHPATCAGACPRLIEISDAIAAAYEADADAGFRPHLGSSHVVDRMRDGSVWINDGRAEAVAC